MPTATFRQHGASIDHTPVADVAAGDVIVQGELVGVARVPIAAGALGALAVEGVFDFPKATGGGTALTTGTDAHWDAGAQQATSDAAAGVNKKLGRVVKDAADADALVRIRLSQ